MSDPQWLREARAEGRILSESRLPSTSVRIIAAKPTEPVKLCVPTFRPSLERPVWEIPLVTASEINGRDWRKRSKRTDQAWSAVSKAIGPHLAYLVRFASDFHAGLPVHCCFTRLGGRRLDAANLPTALKACEDALCWIMGASDGALNWHPRYDQEACDGCGVRISLGGVFP